MNSSLISTQQRSEQERFSEIYQQQQQANHPLELLAVLKLYDDFLHDFPQSVLAYHNRSDVLKHLGFYDLALRDAEQALKIVPDFAMAWCNKAFILNTLGRYQEGWQAYEWRWKTDVETFKETGWPIPRWQGEDIGQAKLLIYAEQGFGDNIQFVRYALEAKKRGLNIVVVNHQPLEHLLNANLAHHGIATSNNGEAISGLKYYVSMMSLPYYFGTTLDNIPYSEGYLLPEANRFYYWQQKINDDHVAGKPQIGVVWAGSPKHHRNGVRSLQFEQILSLFEFDAEFHCLQKEVSEADYKRSDLYKNLHFWQQEIKDFSDTAALIAQLDLVITVDTSVAHLAAAMGKPTWILISYHPDFRWLLTREDSPWYQSVRLFRQGFDFDWQPVISRLQQQLEQCYG
ncbi:glycosyltransferase family 9 protein [Actinobacillus vicugnae]|uniref:glycosyltransferase family 9 protein n=1 Tax=Actinobacillus vicugnae TaxID=2573093 RepID=UPI001242AB7F|nr:glycosyltransferase family 9 protein [Actinobacillus vicugnae]